MDEATKRKISDKRKLQTPPMLGKKHSPETILKMRETAKKRTMPRSVILAGVMARKGKPAWNRGKPATWATGEKSHLWKGGITPETAKRIQGIEWNELRKSIYKRDAWTCQICGKHCSKGIQCHHIEPYEVAQDNSTNNLITLCSHCHPLVERGHI